MGKTKEQIVDELELRLVPLITHTHTHTHTAQLQDNLLGASQRAILSLTGIECPVETSMHFPAPWGIPVTSLQDSRQLPKGTGELHV